MCPLGARRIIATCRSRAELVRRWRLRHGQRMRRLRLVGLVASSRAGEARVCDLNAAFELTRATVSHHLKVLHTAGVLDREKRGVWAYYRLRPEALAAVADVFSSPGIAGAPA